ncbi:hypothetical protein GGS20DRAFT_282561 [Poronia punctata]|nr:hypothetical protein GGS20DRAFT_282561 [Poronia punctata]
MSPKADKKDGSLDSLKALVQSITSLITQLENSVHSIALDKAVGETHSAAEPVDAFSLAHDAATLVKAHTTKLSLLIINEPFTPSAIIKVLRELAEGPIPAIASAVELCATETYTSVVRQELAWRAYRVLKELRSFAELIPLSGKSLSADGKNGVNGEKGSILATGVIWAACDEVIRLRQLGAGGLLAMKVEEYRDTLQDILEELKEWGDETEDDDDDDEVEHETELEGDDDHLSAQQMIDDLMTSQRIPRDDPDKIRERLESCLKKLRLTTLLCTAIVKRRIKSLPSLPAKGETPIPQRLDNLFPILKRLPHRFEEIACAFYELDPEEIDQAMDDCFSDALTASELAKSPWEGDKDGFTEWAEKFQISIKKPD